VHSLKPSKQVKLIPVAIAVLTLSPLSYGVQEYWIVNWQLQTMEVYRRSDHQLKWVGTLVSEESLKSPILPDFLMPMENIFS
jgi:Uma2 family endonuclease